jgi:7-cyano-7-deazaguanine synthase in queuosine biosynthesis
LPINLSNILLWAFLFSLYYKSLFLFKFFACKKSVEKNQYNQYINVNIGSKMPIKFVRISNLILMAKAESIAEREAAEEIYDIIN